MTSQMRHITSRHFTSWSYFLELNMPSAMVRIVRGGEVEPPRYFFTILTLPSSGDKILTEMAINLPCVWLSDGSGSQPLWSAHTDVNVYLCRCRTLNVWTLPTLPQHLSKHPHCTVSMAQWSRPLNRPQCLLAWGLSPACSVQIQVWKGVFQLDWTSMHAMRLNSRTGIKGPPVSSLNCNRSFTLRFKGA